MAETPGNRVGVDSAFTIWGRLRGRGRSPKPLRHKARTLQQTGWPQYTQNVRSIIDPSVWLMYRMVMPTPFTEFAAFSSGTQESQMVAFNEFTAFGGLRAASESRLNFIMTCRLFPSLMVCRRVICVAIIVCMDFTCPCPVLS
eukprot:EG_transcript_7513